MKAVAPEMIPARQATRLWCHVCRKAQKFRAVIVPATSKRLTPGFDGDDHQCLGCGTTIVTCFVETLADG